MRIGFSIGMRLKSRGLCSLLLNNMKNVAENILTVLFEKMDVVVQNLKEWNPENEWLHCCH
jgi:hypothetical protein